MSWKAFSCAPPHPDPATMFYAPMVTIKMTYIVRNHIGLLFSYFLIASYSVERSTKMFHLIFPPFFFFVYQASIVNKKSAPKIRTNLRKRNKEGPI